MKSLSSVGLGLSIVFGCLLLALVAELYYLLYWKRRFTNRELFYMFCLKRPSLRITDTLVQDSQLHFNSSKDILLKPYSDDQDPINSLCGPPRFLFTIVEETKEDLDLEAEEGKSRSLNDLFGNLETPYLTPMESPMFYTPPLTPMDASRSFTQVRFNHLFESAEDAEFNRIRSSPPPKLKFLQDAEEKLQKRKTMEELGAKMSFVGISVDRERKHHNQHSSSSQVLPLASSPSRFKRSPWNSSL